MNDKYIDNQTEKWEPVFGFEGLYEVSNKGRVKSLKRFNPKSGKHGMWYPEKILKARSDKDGYQTVCLTKDGKGKPHKVHRVVLSSFDKQMLDLQVNHIDGNKENNNLDNLEWVTCSENIKHAWRIGLNNQDGSKNRMAKLTEEKVLEIINLFKTTSLSDRKIADMYDIKSDETIRSIRKRKAWVHVTKDIDF